jgi:CheY-like chemotaxis protein
MPHILVVDDDDLVRMMAMRVLSGNGYEVSGAIDGEDALSILEEQAIDLILSDIRMPRMDGKELHRQIKLRACQIPFLAMSGEFSNPGDFDGFLEKPFRIEKLLFEVERLLLAQPVG